MQRNSIFKNLSKITIHQLGFYYKQTNNNNNNNYYYYYYTQLELCMSEWAFFNQRCQCKQSFAAFGCKLRADNLCCNMQVKPQFYAFRWITLLLTQEFDFHEIMRIWDSLLSNSLGIQVLFLFWIIRCMPLMFNGKLSSNLIILMEGNS
eukprot:TRINITY_DN25455_c0_g2_i4.p1 TRINITY_DN25455_c0_g2~~TRINITY_DN25455_c0_g2_i4.p1  ORF type:complete len:149 (-),score=8.93 TRINITY_DN25455_c0_g2_i4:24-470(-)